MLFRSELRLALADDDPAVRQSAIEVLAVAGDRPVKGLVHCLGDPEPAVRAAAERSLVDIGFPAVGALVEAVAGEGCSETKAGAVRALGGIGEPDAIPVIVEAVVACGAGGPVPRAGCDALARLGEPAILPLVGLAGEQALAKDAYRALTTFETDSILAAVREAHADPKIEAARLTAEADRVHLLLGTDLFKKELLKLYQGIAMAAAFSDRGPAAEAVLKAVAVSSRPPMAGRATEVEEADSKAERIEKIREERARAEYLERARQKHQEEQARAASRKGDTPWRGADESVMEYEARKSEERSDREAKRDRCAELLAAQRERQQRGMGKLDSDRQEYLDCQAQY